MNNQIIIQDPSSNPINPPTIESVIQSEESVRYAGFLTRYLALAFDWEILFLITLLIRYSFPSFVINNPDITGLSLTSLFITYKILTVKFYGKSIGKRIFGLKVVGINSEKISWSQAIIRELVSFFISLPFLVGEFFYFFSSKKQTLHDKLVSTVVIKENSLTVFKKICAFSVVFIILIIDLLFTLYLTTKQIADTNKKTDLIESIRQKTHLMVQVKELCQSLPSFQTPQIICVMNNDNTCLLSKMSFDALEDLNKREEIAITDCINYQSELERFK